MRFISKKFRTSSSAPTRDPRPPFSTPMTVIGHRGFGTGEREGNRENTVASILRAYNAGAPWVEVDARRTATDELVAHHNNTLDNAGLITDLPTTTATKGGIATLDELLTALPDNCGINIDVKPSLIDAVKPSSETTAALLLNLLRKRAPSQKLLVSSFDSTVLSQIQTEMPDVSIGLLTWQDFPVEFAISSASHLGADVVCVHASSLGLRDKFIDASFIYHAIHQSQFMGLQVMVWGGEPTDIDALRAWGVDAICVDAVRPVVEKLRTFS